MIKRFQVSALPWSLQLTAGVKMSFPGRTNAWQAIDWLQKWGGGLIKGSGYDLIDSYFVINMFKTTWLSVQDLPLW